METLNSQNGPANEPSWASLLVPVLEKNGFAAPGTLSHQDLTEETTEALEKVLECL